MKTRLTAIAIGLTVMVGATRTEAASVTLYNGAGDPQTQGELVFGSVLGFQNIGAGPVNVDTTGTNSAYAGYSNYNPNITLFPSFSVTPGTRVGSLYSLDPIAGYTLNFAVQINQESNIDANRAGFNFVVISSNVASGVPSSIELGFQNGRIFAQNGPPSIFTAGENTNGVFNPVGAGLVSYSLQVSNTTYSLSANGTPLLVNQPLRDYTSWGGTINPYTTPNFIFLGDNTTRASANFALGGISVTTNTSTAAVPFEFNPTLGLVIVGAFATLHHIKTKNK